jgi:hypothetical protein
MKGGVPMGDGLCSISVDVFNFLGTSENSTFVSQSTVFTLVEVGDKCSLKYKPKNNVQQTPPTSFPISLLLQQSRYPKVDSDHLRRVQCIFTKKQCEYNSNLHL